MATSMSSLPSESPPRPAKDQHGKSGEHDEIMPAEPRAPRLLDQVRHAIRLRHYSIRTENTYVDWSRRFILFNGKRLPATMGAAAEVQAFLIHLAADRHVAAATQNQAKSALLFLYKEVLESDLPWLEEVVTAKGRHACPSC